MKIARDIYLQKLVDAKHNGLIKVVTGVRRCGKSFLLMNLFVEHLQLCGNDDAHIVKIDLEDRRNAKLRDPDALLAFVDGKICDEKMHYILIDEIQCVPEFEDVLNSFLKLPNADVFVTGSNSKFLSSDIITEFRGRGYEIRMRPLNFAEFFSAKSGDWRDAWDEFKIFGGMPSILSFGNAENKANYLTQLFKTTYFSDIIARNKIRNSAEFEKLTAIIASNIGSLTNPKKLENSFKTLKNISLTAPTIKQFLDFLQDAFLMTKVTRYDIKGKRYINTPNKYYFEDVGLRNALLGFRQIEETRILENVIFNELSARGYNVDVGEIAVLEKSGEKYLSKNLEIDFICNKNDERIYIQVALDIPTSEKRRQEERSMLAVKDSFQKVLITKAETPTHRDENGVLIMNLKDFLIGGNGI